MTESEWLTSTDPAAMLQTLMALRQGGPGPCYRVSDRKLRLFACACVRSVWALLTDARSRQAVEVAERYAEGEASKAERYRADRAATDVPQEHDETKETWAAAWMAAWALDDRIAQVIDSTLTHLRFLDAETIAGAAALLREITGNPFRPVHFDPDRGTRDWGEVYMLARAAYAERSDDGTLDPVRLAILADALEETGCTDAAILGHLRPPPPDPDPTPWEHRQHANNSVAALSAEMDARLYGVRHVRGCWVVDLILGKE